MTDRVDTTTWSGIPLTIRIDSDGDVNFLHRGGNFTITREKLRDALRAVGVLEDYQAPSAPDAGLSATVDRLVDRIDALERRAAESPDGHPVGTLLRDSEGDVWRVCGPRRLTLGRRIRPDEDAWTLSKVEESYGPLTVETD